MRNEHFFKRVRFHTGDIVRITGPTEMILVEGPALGMRDVQIEDEDGVAKAVEVLDFNAIFAWPEYLEIGFSVVQTAAEAIATNLKSRRYGPRKIRQPGLPLFSKLNTRKNERTGKERPEWCVLLGAYANGIVLAMVTEEDSLDQEQIIIGKVGDFYRRPLTREWSICTPYCPKKGKFGMHTGLCQEEVQLSNMAVMSSYDDMPREIRMLRSMARSAADYEDRFLKLKKQVSGFELMVDCKVPPWAKAVLSANTVGLFAGSRVVSRFYAIAQEGGELNKMLEQGTLLANGCWILSLSRSNLVNEYLKFVQLVFGEARRVLDSELHKAKGILVSQRANTALKVMKHLDFSAVTAFPSEEWPLEVVAEFKAMERDWNAFEVVVQTIEKKSSTTADQLERMHAVMADLFDLAESENKAAEISYLRNAAASLLNSFRASHSVEQVNIA